MNTNAGCPGAASVKGTPTLEIKQCPVCGEKIEVFSTDFQRDCPVCGHTVYSEAASCIKWCRYAEECIGPEKYAAFKKCVAQK